MASTKKGYEKPGRRIDLHRVLKRPGDVRLTLQVGHDYPPTPTSRVASSSHFWVSPSVHPGTA